MRAPLAVLGVVFSLLLVLVVSGDEAPPKPASGKFKLLEKPGAFETLVNPNCSHCVDEAKRRADQLQKGDPVLAWIRGKYDGGAIPVRFFLAPYRVISDTYGVFVYDPDAGYMRGFEPSLDFRFHGWRNGIMVMRHKDGTLYSALSGKAFEGPRKGDQLKPVPTLESQWGDWVGRYPGTVAYHMFEKYQPVELPGKENADSIATRGAPDPRLPASSEVLGVALDGTARAYPLAVLEKSGGVIADTFAGQKVVVMWYKPTRTAAIFAAEIDGAEPPRPVTFTADSKASSTPFVDRETGSHWDIAGRAMSGELQGKTLRWLPGVQCKWFAWSAEYAETEIYGNKAAQAAPPGKKAASTLTAPETGPASAINKQARPAAPLEAVLVDPADVTPEKVANWAQAGHRAVVVVLDERNSAESYAAVARMIGAAQLDHYYWIEVARNKSMADAHPRWMASLGMHDDWRGRYPKTPLPVKDKEVAKAYPWVPIGYRETFDAHLQRITRLQKLAAEPYRGILLNDLQGGPAACGCGNLQCRWALDYGVPSTTEKLEGPDVAVRFLTSVRKLAPGKEVIPIWMTECEHDDLSSNLRNGARSTGLCGSVPCATGTCPKVFAQQWAPLAADGNGPIGLLVLQKELQRNGPLYAATSWIPKAVDYVDSIASQSGKAVLPRERLWLVVQGEGLPEAERTAARASALQIHPAAVLVALTRIDQSYEPHVIPVK
ncbi:MAG: DUF3179 domain-containing protein [Planctomycetia bacterium]|nr:DUF3179 domain-containing protein [Planctomycetia bacterium]